MGPKLDRSEVWPEITTTGSEKYQYNAKMDYTVPTIRNKPFFKSISVWYILKFDPDQQTSILSLLCICGSYLAMNDQYWGFLPTSFGYVPMEQQIGFQMHKKWNKFSL